MYKTTDRMSHETGHKIVFSTSATNAIPALSSGGRRNSRRSDLLLLLPSPGNIEYYLQSAAAAPGCRVKIKFALYVRRRGQGARAHAKRKTGHFYYIYVRLSSPSLSLSLSLSQIRFPSPPGVEPKVGRCTYIGIPIHVPRRRRGGVKRRAEGRRRRCSFCSRVFRGQGNLSVCVCVRGGKIVKSEEVENLRYGGG